MLCNLGKHGVITMTDILVYNSVIILHNIGGLKLIHII